MPCHATVGAPHCSLRACGLGAASSKCKLLLACGMEAQLLRAQHSALPQQLLGHVLQAAGLALDGAAV